MMALNGAELGFLLLTSRLGNPGRKPLTVPQFRELQHRVEMVKPGTENRDLEERDFLAMGYSPAASRHILELLEEELLLRQYLNRAERSGCVPITRASETYPLILRKRLGTDCPGVLWAKGDLRLLDTSAIALVGSREPGLENGRFAEAVGRYAARQGLTLVSGNARGADRIAQNACLESGGTVISIVADDLGSHAEQKNLLYLSEGEFDESFSSQRALSRNRLIHAMGVITFVAQATLGKGGTWDGTVKNLRHGWSSVVCFRDGSEAAAELEQMGAYLIGQEELADFTALPSGQLNFWDR